MMIHKANLRQLGRGLMIMVMVEFFIMISNSVLY